MIKAADAVQIKERGASPGVALFLLVKPGIVAAVALAGYAGMVVALGAPPPAPRACICLASIVLAAAGSAMLNNVLDRHIDLLMERVQRREGALLSFGVSRAVLCALALIVAALVVGARHLGLEATILLVTAVLSYTIYYTLYLKRRSHWAALLGSLPGALPVLIGASAAGAPIAPAPLVLFSLMLLWQPPHFWLLSLAHQEEYRRAKVPVLPLVKGERFTRRGTIAGIALLLPASLLLWVAGPCSPGYALWALFVWGAFLASCCVLLAKRRYRLAFTSSIAYLVALLAGIITDLCLPRLF